MPLLNAGLHSRNQLTKGSVWFASLIIALFLGALFILAFERFWIGLFVVLALLALGLLTFGPVRWLPGWALAAFVLIPITYTPMVNPVFGRFLSPAVLIMLIWTGRSITMRRQVPLPKLWTATAISLMSWGLLTLLWSIDSQRTLLWTGTICAVVVLPVFLSSKGDLASGEALSRCWLWLGLLLGSMAILEGITQQSFLAGLYQGADSSGIGISQNWSSVRSTTTLGHPLMNATFFAASSAYALMNSALSRSKFALLSGIVAGAGLVFTLSRSGVTALAAGLAIGILAVLITGRMTIGRKLLFSCGTAAAGAAVIYSPLVQARSNSAEGSQSAYLRDVLLQAGLKIAGQDNFVGSGAGTSNWRSSFEGMVLPLENSYVGLLVSSGLLGLALMMCLFLGAIIGAFRRGRFDAMAGMLAFCVQIGAYPLIDNVPVALLMFGMLAYLGFHKSSPTRSLGSRPLVTRPAVDVLLAQQSAAAVSKQTPTGSIANG